MTQEAEMGVLGMEITAAQKSGKGILQLPAADMHRPRF